MQATKNASGVLAVALILVACAEDPVCGCTPDWSVQGTVLGTVYAGDGAVVPEAIVTLLVGVDRCDRGGQQVFVAEADAEGEYLIQYMGDAYNCLAIQAAPPAGVAASPSQRIDLPVPGPGTAGFDEVDLYLGDGTAAGVSASSLGS